MKEQTLKYIKSGISIIPVDIKKKTPYFPLLPNNPNKSNVTWWTPFRTRFATTEEVIKWTNNKDVGIAIVTGSGSGGVELLDFDNHLYNADTIFKEFATSVKHNNKKLFDKLVIESTQSGGYHVWYRCEEVQGNLKIAKQLDSRGHEKAIIETRGEGGYGVIYPTPGYKLLQGDLCHLAVISADDRELLFNICKSFNTAKIKDYQVPYSTPKNGKQRPGDAFNERGDVKSLLIKHGWQFLSKDGSKEILRRPGKNQGGPSATLNYENTGKLYVFSSNASPFDSETSYDKFAIYTMLEHRGDFAQAAKQLLKEGYGEVEPSFRGYTTNSDIEVDDKGQLVSKTLGKATTNNEKVKSFIDANYDVRKNVVTQKFEIKRKDEDSFHIMEDADLNQLWIEIDGKVAKNFGTEKISKLLNLRDYLLEYHPFKDYFNNLPKWDGSDHIGDVISLITPQRGQEEKLQVLFTKWIVAVVASSIEEKENHSCFVFAGPQGIGKTSFFRNLVPPELKDYYKEDQIKPDKNDDKIKITNSFLINMDELDGITNKETHTLKQFLTSSVHDLRLPYAHFSSILKRRASFCGSVNEAGFLGDSTGSRRFFIVDAEEIDYTSPINHNQLYAQALDMLNNNFPYWLNMAEIAKVNSDNEKYEKANPAKDLLDKYFDVIDTKNLTNDEIRAKVNNFPDYDLYTSTDIIDYFKRRHPHIDVWHNSLGNELKKRGGDKKLMKVNGKPSHLYLLKEIKPKGEGSEF